MKKNISIILVFTLIISMCSGALCADEAAFEEAEVYEGDAVHVETVYEGDVSHVETVYEGDAAHIETVFEDPSNRDEEEYVTADSVVFTEDYSSSDLKKAYVEKSGKVTAKGAGTATITATVKMKNAGGNVTKKLTCEVAVKKPTLSVSPTSMSLKKRQTKTLTVKATPAGTVSYSSSDTKIATVNSKGKKPQS